MSSDHAVKVAVRIRPLVDSERNRGCQSIVKKTPTQPQVVVDAGIKSKEMFTYNYVFAPDDTQEMLYENAVRSMVMKLFGGYNVTILAYGQTGSGKTHTMGTTFDGQMNEEMGVIPRAIEDIFQKIDEMSENDFTVQCSFVELYQEKLYDLLSSSPRDQSIVDLREVDSKVVIPNLTEINVKTTLETIKCLIQGSSDRAVGATAMNAVSSRSHAIFTISLQKVPKEDPTAATIAKFHLVDLAGSERSKKTLAVGEQFKEGVKINQGLLALGNVISALGSAQQNGGHVGYRDSKLTRLLQDSLGGNSMTLMIACVSPADYNNDETLGTLRYADRAKKIKNKPVVNEDPKTAEINRLKAEIQTLRVELLSKSGIGVTASTENCKICEMPPSKDQLKQQIREMAERMQITLFEMAHRENIITEYEDTVESLNGKISELKEKIVSLDKVNTADMSPDDLREYQENVHLLTTTIMNLNDHMNERKDCIAQSSKASETQLFNATHPSVANNEEEFIETDHKYIKKQTGYQQELREMKQELGVKEKLLDKLSSNYQKMCSINDEQNVMQKMTEYEKSIAKLEKEREELQTLLRNKNGTISVKLAEERRKRVQQLEAEITEIKRKNKHQAQLLKQREKDSEQIKKLNTEILQMKQMKIRLVRKMKSESDEFRQWRAEREKELVQLRAKDRKMQSEAVKKDLLHQKQKIVLQRKFEESNLANKRLKEALLKVKQSKENKQTKGVSNRSTAWLNEELEVITSIVDVKQSFEQLNETRAELTSRLNKMKRQRPIDKEAVKSLEEEIEMHNAQITDLRGKINTNDLDAKVKSIYENAQSLVESRNIIKHLLTSLIESRNSFNVYFAQSRDYKHSLDTVTEEKKEIEEEKKEMEAEYKQKFEAMQAERNQLLAENEEKTTILLKAISHEGEASEIVNVLQQKISEKDEAIERLENVISKRSIRPRYIEKVRLHNKKKFKICNLFPFYHIFSPLLMTRLISFRKRTMKKLIQIG